MTESAESQTAKAQAGADHRVGVLLVNLGTPDAPTASAVRRYLAEFLSDTRVIEVPRLIWWFILHGIILRIRPGAVAKNYASIWGEDGSPLLAITRQQAERLQKRLDDAGREISVQVAMRYGNPSIAEGLQQLIDQGVTRVLVLSAYPQYCAATTATVFDKVTEVMRGMRRIPEVRFINDYHDHPLYIEALASSVREAWEVRDPAQKLLLSFHGIPQRNVDRGDPYQSQCQRTAHILAEKLGIDGERCMTVFQSRFGPAEWLQPYCVDTLEKLGSENFPSVDILCPGFAADCLETLEEIEVENREVFVEAGGGDYHYIPALNARDDHIDLLLDLVDTHTAGW
ncbi:MAG: ferrochelatase [Pseudomonadota bacterium]